MADERRGLSPPDHRHEPGGSRFLFACVCFSIPLLGCGKSSGDLTKQLASPDASIRLRAIDELQKEKPETAIPALTAALRDENVFVRRNAARALRKFGPQAKEAVPSLQLLLRDKERGVRKAAAQAIKEIDPGALPKGKTR